MNHSLLPPDNELQALVIEAPTMEALIRTEPLNCYYPCTQTYYVPPPPSKPVLPAFYSCLSHIPHQLPTTSASTIINIPPPPTPTYENSRVPYNYEEGAGESYPQLSAEEVADLVGLITRSGRIIELIITNLCQDSAQGKAKLELERTEQQEKEQESLEQRVREKEEKKENEVFEMTTAGPVYFW